MGREQDRFAQRLGSYSRAAEKHRAGESSTAGKSRCHWLRYAAAASAGLTTATASDTSFAAVVHSGPINRQMGGASDTFSIDLDGNGVVDFSAFNIRYSGFTYPYNNFTDYWAARFLGANGSIVVSPGTRFVQQLGPSALIDGNRSFSNFPTIRSQFLTNTTFGGQQYVDNGTFSGNGFAGARFEIDGQTHFGWIQLNVDGFGKNYTIIDWAYENVVDAAIRAGDTIGSQQLDGDYNDDGVVNAADYVAWRNNEGTDNTLPNDPHGGTIGPDQFNTWRDNFGKVPQIGSGASAAIPEPTTVSLGMLALGAAGIAALRRRKNEPPRRQE